MSTIIVNNNIKSGNSDLPVAYADDIRYAVTGGSTQSVYEKIESLHPGQGERGQSSFKSSVFCRSNATSVAAPTGGSYNSPVPTTAGWYDGVPDGEEQLWMSTRIFTSDGQSPQQEVWSTPSKISDTADIDFEFSSVELNPGDPTNNPSNWHNTALSTDIWMAVRKKKNGVWGPWEVTKIKGEKGEKGDPGSGATQGDIDEAARLAEEALVNAWGDLSGVTEKMSAMAEALGESGGVYTGPMAWNNTSDAFIQTVGQWDVTGASGTISEFIQGPSGLALTVSKQKEDLIGVSKLLVGADGLYAGVSDLATAAGMTAGDIRTAQKEMKSDIISQTVAAGAVMVNKYGHYCTDDTQHYAIIWNESQDEVAYYDEATEKFYEIQPNGYSEISAPAKWHYINKDDAEFYDYVTVNADKMSNITQTSSEIKAVVANFEEGGAASWVLRDDSFEVIANNIDLNGKVTAKSLYAADSENSDVVSIDEGDIALSKDGETVVSINNDVVDDSTVGLSVKKILGGYPVSFGNEFGPIGLHIKGNAQNDGTRTGKYFDFSFVQTPTIYTSFKYSGTSFTLDASPQDLFKICMHSLGTNGNNYHKPLSFYDNHIEIDNSSYIKLYYGRSVTSYADCNYLTWSNKKVITTSTVSDEGKTFLNDVMSYINTQNGDYKFYIECNIHGKLYQTYYNTDGGSLETSYYPKVASVNEKIHVTDNTESEYASMRIGRNGMLLDLGSGVYVSMSQHNGNPYIKLMSRISDTDERGFLLTEGGKVYYCKGNVDGVGNLARLITVDSAYQTPSGHSAAPSAGSTAYGGALVVAYGTTADGDTILDMNNLP